MIFSTTRLDAATSLSPYMCLEFVGKIYPDAEVYQSRVFS